MPEPKKFADHYTEVASAVYVWVHVHIRPALQPHADPSDILQEIWCRAWQAFDRFDSGKGNFRAWILGIAQNVLLEELRRVAKRKVTNPSRTSRDATLDAIVAEATSMSERAARTEAVQRLLAAAEELPADERRLLVFVGLEERGYTEVAERLDITSEAVRSRWRRLRDRLRQLDATRGILC